MLALIVSTIAGMLVAVQSRINGGLSAEIGNGYVTATVSFGSGLILLTIGMLVSRRGRDGLARIRDEVRGGKLPVWTLFGGVAGGAFVLAQGLVAPVTGLALFTVGVVAGQVLGGLVLDRIGLGPGGRIDPTVFRVLGTVLAIVAVVLSVGLDAAAREVMWLVVLPIVIGAGMATQSMTNGITRAAAQSALTSTFINFVVGTAVLCIAAVVSIVVQGWPAHWPSEPWYYVGGVIGVAFIAIASVLVRTAGVLLLSMSNVAGQLVAAVAFEAIAPLAGGVSSAMMIGGAVALTAVVVAAIPRGPTSRA